MAMSAVALPTQPVPCGSCCVVVPRAVHASIDLASVSAPLAQTSLWEQAFNMPQSLRPVPRTGYHCETTMCYN